MNDYYFILEDGEQTGPFSLAELIEKEPDIHTRVLSPIENTWMDACDVPELYDYFLSQGLYFPTESNLASFWIRLGAFAIDIIIVSIISDFIIVFLSVKGVMPDIRSLATMQSISKMPVNDLLLMQGVFYLTIVIYNSICEASQMKGSVGKIACRLAVVDADGQGISFPNALARSLGKVVSLYFMGVGFLSIFWSEHRQALHDYVAKTYVVKKS